MVRGFKALNGVTSPLEHSITLSPPEHNIRHADCDSQSGHGSVKKNLSLVTHTRNNRLWEGGGGEGGGGVEGVHVVFRLVLPKICILEFESFQ